MLRVQSPSLTPKTNMRDGSRLGALALLGALAPQGGCSFMFVDKPTVSAGYAQGSHCTSLPVAPVIDMLMMVWQGARAVSAAASDDNDFSGEALSRGAVMSSGALLFMLFGASMMSGFTSTNACRAALEEAEPRDTRTPPPDAPSAPARTPPAAAAAGSAPAAPDAPAVQVAPAQPLDVGQPPPADGGQPPPPAPPPP